MDRYQRVEKPKPESSPSNNNEIRITARGLIRNYVSYAARILQENGETKILLQAMGRAISKTVAVAENLKKRFPLLHQDTMISSVSITDVFEPIEEGLQIVEMTRKVSMISITMSWKELNGRSPGPICNRALRKLRNDQQLPSVNNDSRGQAYRRDHRGRRQQ